MRGKENPATWASVMGFPARRGAWLPQRNPVANARRSAVPGPCQRGCGGCLEAASAAACSETTIKLLPAKRISPPAWVADGLSPKESCSEFGWQIAVDFEPDADFHECGSCPVHSRLPISRNGGVSCDRHPVQSQSSQCDMMSWTLMLAEADRVFMPPIGPPMPPPAIASGRGVAKPSRHRGAA